MFWQVLAAHSSVLRQLCLWCPSRIWKADKEHWCALFYCHLFLGQLCPCHLSCSKSCLAAIQCLSIPGPHGSNQTSPFTFTYCPHGFSHIYSTRRPLFPLPRPGWIWWGFGHPETPQPCCQTLMAAPKPDKCSTHLHPSCLCLFPDTLS